MPDRIATMMILRSLRDIADELRALREELRQLHRSRGRANENPRAALMTGLRKKFSATCEDENRKRRARNVPATSVLKRMQSLTSQVIALEKNSELVD
jgi:hypothetical protein